MKKYTIALIAATALVATSAMAAPATSKVVTPNERIGFYADGGLGYGYNGVSKDVQVQTKDAGGSLSRGGFAGSVAAGYQFDKHFAVETSYLRMPGVKVKNAGVADETVSHNAISMAIKGMYTVTDNMDVFAKAGVAYEFGSEKTVGSAKLNYHTGSPLLAVGAEYFVTNNVSVNAQAVSLIGTNGGRTTFAGLIGAGYKL